MEKQVKVDVTWNGSSVRLTTDRGWEYDFVIGNFLAARNSCETIVASHVASLLVPTVVAFFKSSDSCRFSFTFKAFDDK